MDKFKEAEEHTKTSLMKWTADYLSASSSYEKAGSIFRGKGDIKMAIESFKRSGLCHDKVSGHSFNSGLAFEKAANVAKGNNLKDEASSLFQEASKRFVSAGEVIKAASSLSSAASLSNDNAEELFIQSVDLVRGIDKGKAQSLDIIRPALAYMIRNGDVKRSLAMSEQLLDTHTALGQDSSAHKIRIGIVVLHLSRGDVVAAKQAFADHMNNDSYLSSQECAAAEEILNAYDKLDPSLLEKAKSQPLLNYLERDYVNLLKQLKITGSTFSASTSTQPKVSTSIEALSSSKFVSSTAENFSSTTSTSSKTAVSSSAIDSYLPAATGLSKSSQDDDDDIDLR